MKSVHLKISGKVQGVFFRAKAKEIAEIHKISGWIRNTDDGKVEAFVSGEDQALEAFIVWCKQGPEKAKVKDVLVNYMEIEIFDKFKVIR
jgi:acylphosphatase